MTLETQEKRQKFVQFIPSCRLVERRLKIFCLFFANCYFHVVHTTVLDFDGVYAEIKKVKVSLTICSDVPNRFVRPSSLGLNLK